MKCYLFVLSIVLLFACGPLKDVEYKNIESWHITNLSNAPEINFKMKYFNPNKMGCKVSRLKIDVQVQNQSLGQVVMNDKIKVKANSDFTLPVTYQINMLDAAKIIPTGLSTFFGNSEIPVSFKGEIMIHKGLVRKKIKFNGNEKFNSSNIKLM